MNKHTLEEYLEFLAEYTPHFNNKDGQYEMFTVPTQHIKADSIAELLDIGIACAISQNGKSPIRHILESIENNQIQNEHINKYFGGK